MQNVRYGQRKPLAAVIVLTILAAVPNAARAQDDDLRERLLALNSITGDETVDGQVRALAKDPAATKKLLNAALPMAKEKEQPFNFNAAYILGQVALELKEHGTSQVFFRVCLEQAAKLGSSRKLVQGLAGLERNIDALFTDKKYEESAKLSQELLETLEKQKISQEVREEFLRHWIRALTKGGRADEADKMLENLLKVRGQNWRNVELRAWYFRDTGRLNDAAKTYEEVIQLLDKDRDGDWVVRGDRIARLHMTLGQVYFNLKEADKSNNHIKKSAEVYEDLLKQILGSDQIEDPERGRLVEQIRYLLSGIYVDMKNVDQAIEYLKQLVADHPDNPTYNNDLGYIMADNDKGSLDEAEKLIRRALEEDRKRRRDDDANINAEDDKDNAAYLDSLGWVLFKKKQYPEAKKFLLKAVEDPKDGQHTEIYDHLADVHLALGEKDAAIAAWKKGLEVVRDFPREQIRKEQVEKKLREHQP